MMTHCPQCNAEADYQPGECEFCPECGASLKPEPAPAETAPVDFRQMLNSVFSPAADVSAPKNDLCPLLRVEYNRNIFFLRGAQTVLKLRLIPQSGELQKIFVFMEVAQGAMKLRKTIPVEDILTVERPVQLSIPHCPDMVSGMLSFTFRVGCKSKDSTEFFQFSLEFPVYDPAQSGSTLGNIIINQNVQATDAGYITMQDDIGKIIGDIKNSAPTAHELIGRLNALAPVYMPLSLSPTSWTPEENLIQGTRYACEKLAIEWNGYKLLLLSKSCVKFGRTTEKADLVVHSGGEKLGPKDYPNNTVSRLHAEVLYCEDTVKLFDRSSWGTYINGRKPDSVGVPIPNSALVEFGDIHWQMELQHCFGRASHYFCESCAAHRIKSMTFSRKDQEKEYYLLIWECCELGRLNPALADWTIFYRQGAFYLRTPEQLFYALRPGLDVVSMNQRLHVTYF